MGTRNLKSQLMEQQQISI
ncbi:hypothetical protein HaLaN_15492, partial [Haematococcus lacustris]